MHTVCFARNVVVIPPTNYKVLWIVPFENVLIKCFEKGMPVRT